jgi:hypothetical protein
MAADKYIVFEGTLSTNETAVQSSSIDYSPSSGRLLIIRAVALFNGNASEQTAAIKVGGTYILSSSIQPLSSSLLDCQNAIVLPGEKLLLRGQVDNDLKYRIWGVEVDA